MTNPRTNAAVAPGAPKRQNPRQGLGATGERLAKEYLVAHGHEVLAENWRCQHGEIDLVTRDGAWIVVTEVKTRSGLAAGDPLEAIHPRKLARLRTLAGVWSAEHPEHAGRLRLDAVSVLLVQGKPVIRHVTGIGS